MGTRSNSFTKNKRTRFIDNLLSDTFDEMSEYLDHEKIKKLLPQMDPDVWRTEDRFKMRDKLAFKLF